MGKGKIGKVIFARIRGRVVPIKVSEATLRRQALRKAASARTNLHIQRQKALKAVRLTVMGKTRLIGKGLEARVYSAGKIGVVKAHRGKWQRDEFFERGVFKSFLSRRKLAPRTFTVQTSKRTFLVQERAARTDLEIRRAYNWGKPGRAEALKRKVSNLRERIKGLAIIPNDLDTVNTGVLKGRVVSTDSGQFGGKLINIAKSNRDRINKFIISLDKRTTRKYKLDSAFGGLVRSEERIRRNREDIAAIFRMLK